jgi:hypothetical protein
LEYFKVVEGAVIMEIEESSGSAYRRALRASDAVLEIPPGAWHATYAPRPSVVDNIYCFVRGAGEEEDEKYDRQMARPHVSRGNSVSNVDLRLFVFDSAFCLNVFHLVWRW